MTTETTTKRRWIPHNSLPIEEPGLGVCYVGPAGHHKGWFAVTAYREKAIKPDFSYRYKTEAEVDAKIAAFFDGIRQHKKLVQDRRTSEFEGHSFVIGDIVTNSWGYDQTNVDWYRVSHTTKNYVWLIPVHSALTPDEGCGPMSGKVALALDADLKPIDGKGKETKHRAVKDHVTMRHGSGSKYTGGSLYSSWYA